MRSREFSIARCPYTAKLTVRATTQQLNQNFKHTTEQLNQDLKQLQLELETVSVLEPAQRRKLTELREQVRTLRPTGDELVVRREPMTPDLRDLSLSSSSASSSLSPFTSPQSPEESMQEELETLRASNRKLESGGS